MKFNDPESQEVVKAIAPLLKADENSLCAYLIVAIDHDKGHMPITLASMPPEEMVDFISALAALVYANLHAN
jgi:hypothetical protein